ncbi:MAG TPA: hydroxysteroid dehydrogenase-like protein 2, partial [Anaerolineae bacterium]|nr:hydroxysteroid dehydrogenase-like protein 2 [Anaerolineae bacterium]
AATRLTQDVLPADFISQLRPEYVAPLVLYLCSEQCPASGGVYNAGMGHYSRATVLSGPGIWLGDDGEVPGPEAIAANWQGIISLKGAEAYHDANAALMAMLAGPREAPEEVEKEGDGREGRQVGESGVGGGSVLSVFDNLSDAFQAKAATGVDVVFQFCISGPGGGEWYTEVKAGTCTVEAGVHQNPTTTLRMSDEDFLKYVSGQLPAMQAYTTGRLKIEGDLMKSQLVEKLFRF